MKKIRQCENENDEIKGSEDRLGDLPDCVLLHILSFLNTKHVVQTCVLSTRWRHLWKRIPTLILHCSKFTTKKHFTIFVSKILTLRDPSTALHALDLDRRGDIEPHVLKKILNYVSSNKTHLKELGISIHGDGCLVMSCVSSCHALTSLNLSIYPRGSRRNLNYTPTLFPKSLNLPLLTSLDITNFVFCGGESDCVEPFFAFTKLNSLVIRSCNVKDAQILIISSDTLANLAINSSVKKINSAMQNNSTNFPEIKENNPSNFVEIKLSTPNLRSFNFAGHLIQKISGSGLSSVRKVNINDLRQFHALAGHGLVLFSWLLDFANVESLTVTSTTLQILSLVPDLFEVKLPSLCNLKLLEVELIPLYDGSLSQSIEDSMLEKAAAKSCKEVAKLRKAFNAGLVPPAIPDGMVDFLRQNSPSAVVNISTYFPDHFNLKQVEESIKGAKIVKYRSRYAAPGSSSIAPASAPAPSSVSVPASAAPPNLHLCCADKDDKSSYEDKV
ncbi:putative F-box/FBD/LRR-repeat protein At1g78760 [Trifolium pratense]|uniref:Uncharacterized protein n=1 Tax=Trifolium pratense TaxID=57577 RepID=A0ACB0M8W9_TRIPR|nr:putative F-box/FBD/LRR-repeat protein At1g78760 [Trifolium pratense]XP_045826042.1 putative F-box/FBD/LRR-repeat protein At1g78760 [Trifolium pratense]CAJ2678322.1 unnamed protein product [Trifolium pratense]